ncbi:ABC transporter ATP-binding protein [Bacteroidota bacterium]
MHNQNDKILNISDLEIGYFQKNQKKSIFKNISLSARKGELIALIGRNGVGKSTLLKSIARINNFINGKILIHGKPIHEYNLKDWAKKLSFVSTEPVNITNLTVKELVTLGRHPYTNWMFSLTNEDHEVIDKSISIIKINHISSKNIDEISDGERQRALIARTLAQNTDIIILDEPTAYLDLPNKFEIIHLLRELSKNENKTIIFSSHDLNIAITEADKIWLMDEKNIFEGAPEDLVINGTFERLFDNSEVNFNKSSGEVKLMHKSTGEVFLSGSGIEYIWTQRSLERLSIVVSIDKTLPIKVRIVNVNNIINWELELYDEKFVFNSIYELNLHLKQINT